MGTFDKSFKWFSVKYKDRKELNLGYVLDGELQTMEDVENYSKPFNLKNIWTK